MKGMGVHPKVTPSTEFADTHLYTWVEIDTVRVKCLAQKQNIMFLTRVRTRSARSEAKHASHEVTTSPKLTQSE